MSVPWSNDVTVAVGVAKVASEVDLRLAPTLEADDWVVLVALCAGVVGVVSSAILVLVFDGDGDGDGDGEGGGRAALWV